MSETEANTHPALLGRRLLREQQRAALGTSLRGCPYVSLALIVADVDASPLLLLSDLAQHSRNIAFDPRVSLLLDGTARFTARHPTSSVYAGFGDFHLYRVVVERGHLVAGFGRIHWIDGGDLLLSADASALAAAEPEILKHMNEDHADAVADYARRLLGRSGDDWRMVGIDPEGIDLRCEGETARLGFAAPVFTPAAARAALIELAEGARK
jgi:putative heme iron utilization protein